MARCHQIACLALLSSVHSLAPQRQHHQHHHYHQRRSYSGGGGIGGRLRRLSMRASALSEASAAIESIWALPITNEFQTPSPGTLAKRVSSKRTVAVLWARDTWDGYKSRRRYLRAVINAPKSTILRALAPMLAGIALWTSLSYWQRWKFTGSALSYLASPIGLMLAFRVNSVVSRFHEAR